MYENIRAILRLDEPISLHAVEPFDYSLGHGILPAASPGSVSARTGGRSRRRRENLDSGPGFQVRQVPLERRLVFVFAEFGFDLRLRLLEGDIAGWLNLQNLQQMQTSGGLDDVADFPGLQLQCGIGQQRLRAAARQPADVSSRRGILAPGEF